MPNRYRDLSPTTLLSPVPVVLLSCGTQEKPNAITIAWAGTVCSHPPMVSVSIRPSRYSYELIRNSGEFVVNLPDVRFAKAVDYCGVRSGRDEDKFSACGLAAVPMPGLESAPALDGFPAHLGCKVRQIIQLGSHDLFLSEIVSVRVRDDLFGADSSMRLDRADLLCYSHGVYQRAEGALGFFGWSVARPDVLDRRMEELRKR